MRIEGCLSVEGCDSGERSLTTWHIWLRRAGLLHVMGQSEAVQGIETTSGFWYFMEQILRNWHIWWGRASWPKFIIMHEEQTETEYREGAPVHISAASARRRGPPLAIKPSSCCEGARWRENECADPRQLCQLKWRSTRAGGCISLDPSSLQAMLSSRYFLIVNSFLQIFANSILETTEFLGNSKFDFNKFEIPVGLMYIVIRSDLIRVDRFDNFIEVS